MSLTAPDTDPAAAAALAAVLRSRSPARKLAMMGQLHQTARELAAAGVRRRHPGLDAGQVRRAVADRMLRGTLPPADFAAYTARTAEGHDR